MIITKDFLQYGSMDKFTPYSPIVNNKIKKLNSEVCDSEKKFKK